MAMGGNKPRDNPVTACVQAFLGLESRRRIARRDRGQTAIFSHHQVPSHRLTLVLRHGQDEGILHHQLGGRGCGRLSESRYRGRQQRKQANCAKSSAETESSRHHSSHLSMVFVVGFLLGPKKRFCENAKGAPACPGVPWGLAFETWDPRYQCFMDTP